MSEQVTTQPESEKKSSLADIVAGDTVISVKSTMTASTYQLVTVRRVTKTQIILGEGRREIRYRRADGNTRRRLWRRRRCRRRLPHARVGRLAAAAPGRAWD